MKVRAACVVAVLVGAPLVLVGPSWAAPAVTCDGLPATIVGTAGSDRLVGTSGADVIVGRAGDDTIDGGGGDDVICGNMGRDTLDGGAGDDRVFGGRATDYLAGGAGDDRLTGGKGQRTLFTADAGDDVLNSVRSQASLDYTEAPGPLTIDLEAGTAVGWGSDTIRLAPDLGAYVYDSRYDDTLLGSENDDALFGRSGVDTVDGRGGNDDVEAAAGHVSGGDGRDFVRVGNADPGVSSADGGPGDDRIDAPAAVPHIDGGPGNDDINLDATDGVGPSGTDVTAGDGSDILDIDLGLSSAPWFPFVMDMTSGSLEVDGVDGLATGFEDLEVNGNLSSAEVDGTDGPNQIIISGGHSMSDDVIHGLGGDDTLGSGQGNDTIDGGDGNDTIDGQQGTDTADGGPGTDTCYRVENAVNCETTIPAREPVHR